MISIEEMMGNKREHYKNYINSISTRNNSFNYQLFRKYVKENKNEAVEINNILNKFNISMSVFKYFLNHPELKEYSEYCVVCGKKIDLNKKFSKTCCKKCADKNPEKLEKAKKTWIKNLGVDHPSKSKEVQEKIQNKCLELYGCKCSLQNKEIQEKVKKTWIKNLGVDNPSKSKEVQEKSRNTLFKNHGVYSPLHSEKIKEKYMSTNLKKHGAKFPFASKEVQEKRKETISKKIKNDPLYYEKSNEKRKKTNVKKYGYENAIENPEIKEKSKNIILFNYRSKHYKEFLENAKNCDIEILTPYEEHLTSDLIKYKCKNCNNIFNDEYKTGNKICCPNCAKYNISNEEIEVGRFVSDLIGFENIIKNSFDIIGNRRELDIYIPSKKLAIEYDGIYWHSTEYKPKNYHIEKTLLCRDKNIRLIHVFSNDWVERKDVVKSIISSALGIYKETIYARKCEVKELDNELYKNFLNENHIQGYYKAKIKLGLFYNNELVSCIGIDESRYKKDEIEVIRFCNKLNTKVLGALSKLIKHSGIKSLVSYVDLKYFNGIGYEKAGFKLIRRNPPSYFYIENKTFKILKRERCQKHRLHKLLGDKFDSNLTETQNMLNNGYLKIYDCGNLKYKLEL